MYYSAGSIKREWAFRAARQGCCCCCNAAMLGDNQGNVSYSSRMTCRRAGTGASWLVARGWLGAQARRDTPKNETTDDAEAGARLNEWMAPHGTGDSRYDAKGLLTRSRVLGLHVCRKLVAVEVNSARSGLGRHLARRRRERHVSRPRVGERQMQQHAAATAAITPRLVLAAARGCTPPPRAQRPAPLGAADE